MKKINQSEHSLSIIRDGAVDDQVVLHTETYFLHDIVHYCVESELRLTDGFCGMVAQGYKMAELGGKENELTDTLREVEKVVGPVQAVYSGYMSREMFAENLKLAILPNISAEFIDDVLGAIEVIMQKWKYLPIGEPMELEFNL